MTPQQLKNSILQMAMQGKLVEQRPEEGTGEELYQQIQKEKQKLIKEGKIKKQKTLPEITEDEVPFEIPESWKWVRIKEVCSKLVDGDHNPPKGIDKISEFIMASSRNINHDRLVNLGQVRYLTEEVFNKENERTMASKGDIFFTSVGSLGRSCVYNGTLNICFQRSVTVITTLLYNYYLKYYFDSDCFQDKVTREATGTAQKGFYLNQIGIAVVPVPPLAEQKRIVAKIEEIMPFIDRYAVAYDHLQSYNTRFPDDLKKSILQMAIQGKLVPQDPNDEPASVLLEKIAKEKQKLVKEGKIKKQKPLPPINDEEIPFDIPESWVWVRLGNVITDTEAGKSPQCKNRPATKQEWGVIKTTAIQDGYFLAGENKVLPSGFQIKSDQVVHAGDLLITRAGPQNRTGVTCIVNNEPGNLILSDKTVRIRYVKGFVNENYLMYALKSPAVQRCITGAKSGMAESQVNISQNNMRLFVLPFPPLAEQKRIVAKLDELLPQIDGLK